MSSRRSKNLTTKFIEEENRTLRARFIKALAGFLNQPNIIAKTTPVQPIYVFEPRPEIRRPQYDYINLFEVATNSWPLRRAFRAITQECLRNRWSVKAKFAFMCTKCGKEYAQKPEGEKCTALVEEKKCEGALREPSTEELKRFEGLLDRPNRDYHFDDLVRSSIFYDLALDDWYWGIAYRRRPKTVPDENGDMKIVLKAGQPELVKEAAELYVEDARFIYPIADRYGHLGGYEYFCPECYDKIEGDQPVIDIQPDMPKNQIAQLIRCPYCGNIMEQTAYVQEVQGQVVARFTKDDLVHGSSSRVLPALFGNSKIIAVWKIVNTVLAMDDYNFEVYNEGKVGAIIGMPGFDDMEIATINKRIEEEIKRLDKEDIQTGRYERSKKIRTLLLGLKKDTIPTRIPVMEDLKKMQSIEFYQLYTTAIAEVYGVTPTFSTETGPQGTRQEIEVQNRTIKEHQENFTDLFNSEVLPVFNVHDWVLVFNPVEARDELRLAQINHTKSAAALTWLRAGFEVTIGPDQNLIVTGKGKIVPSVPEGSRADEAPKDMLGKPWRAELGEPTRTQGETLELFAKALIKEVFKETRAPQEEEMLPAERVRMPISWYSATQIRISDRVYALNNDKDEVYVMMNGHELDRTRTPATNINYAIANLLDNVLEYIGSKLEGVMGFNADEYNKGKKEIVSNMRREFDPKLLVNLANYFDSINMNTLGEKIDNLRMRLEQIKPKTMDIQPQEASELERTGEMIDMPEGKPETDEDIQRKRLVQAKAPFGVTHEEESLYNQLKKVIDWATKQIKDGKDKEKTMAQAKVKAERIIDKSYDELIKRAEATAKRRTKKDVIISPEELRRIDDYKKISLSDFKRILEDGVKNVGEK